MTIKEFNNQSFQNKLLMVNTKGIEIDSHLTMFGTQKMMVCYSINGLFVEYVFNLEQNEIEDIIAFNDGEALHRYTYFIPNIARGILNNI